MKVLLVFVKIVFVFLSWVFAVALLGVVKSSFIQNGASLDMCSVMWMALPITMINAIVVFMKQKYQTVGFIEFAVSKMKSSFESVIIGYIFLLFFFLLLAFIGSYLIMMGIHLLTLPVTLDVILLGIIMFVLGLFLCLFSNNYFKSE